MILTAQNYATLSPPAGKTDHIFWAGDLTGFGMRARNGIRTWIVQFRVNGKTRRMKIGTVDRTNYADAKKTARRQLSKAELGQDLQEEKRLARERAGVTFGSTVTDYLAAKRKLITTTGHKKQRITPRTFEETERYLTKHWRPLNDKPLHEIDTKDMARRLNQIETESGSVAKARAYSAVSGFLGWAMGEGLIASNPVIDVNKPPQPESRKRVLADAELAEVWNACRDDDYGRIVRLLILTGARRAEIGGLRWSEINLDRAIITLPGARTKNGQEHVISLCPLAVKILHAVPRQETREYLFGTGAAGFGGWSKAKDALDQRILEARRHQDPKAAAMDEWRQHDLRRTAATVMAQSVEDGCDNCESRKGLGIKPHIVEAVLNHISGHKGGVAGVYNLADYLPETRQAFHLWGEHVRQLVEGGERKLLTFPRVA